MDGLYPAMLRLGGRRCVVVGGGAVAARKVGPLLAAGASVLVVAPTVAPALRRLAAAGEIELARRAYRHGDLERASLAFAATDSPEVNAAVAGDAEQLGIPVNVADDSERSSFHVPAALRRGDLTVAVATGGRSPAFARLLRQEIESLLTPERLALLELYAALRVGLTEAGRPTSEAAWDAVDRDALRLLAEGRRSEAEQLLRRSVAVAAGSGGN